jgi:threonine/homoserine/homoserine lactone efflux protein
MGSAIAVVAPTAIGMALISPLPIMVVILMLLSPQGKSTAPAFLAGWVLGMLIVFGLLLFVVSPENIVGDDSDPSTVSSIVTLLLGTVLLFLAFRKWRTRPQEDEEMALPSWMGALDNASPAAALGFGAFFSGLNPKNFAFMIAAVIAIAQGELTAGQKLIPVAIYVLLASVGVVAPVIWYAVAQRSAVARLAAWRDWLVGNYALLMTIVLLLFGVTLFARGIGGLIG